MPISPTRGKRRVLAVSDAFEILAQADAAAVAEPGGSIRDQLTIDAAQAAGVSLYFTGVRHFFH